MKMYRTADGVHNLGVGHWVVVLGWLWLKIRVGRVTLTIGIFYFDTNANGESGRMFFQGAINRFNVS